MDKVIEETLKLKEKLYNLPEVKEYFALKAIYEKDEELARMRKEIARLKSLGKEEERNNLLKIYNSHPLVNNFQMAKEEVKQILQSIKNIIQ